MLMPRQPVPALLVPTLAHGAFTLADDGAPNFTLVVFYRGLHCPICLKYLLELGRLQPEFEQRCLGSAREWGLYISTSRGTTSIGIEEPALFAEPACSSCAPTARSSTARCRRCPSRGRTSTSCLQPSISRWPRATRRAVSTPALSECRVCPK